MNVKGKDALRLFIILLIFTLLGVLLIFGLIQLYYYVMPFDKTTSYLILVGLSTLYCFFLALKWLYKKLKKIITRSHL